ncbi:MAG TPA: hypothetical protein VOA64_07970, partial [Candidatus Dormibacteraeota bacterium]|nr:hypothetical protein [Candidatus Dormibacteraeota bacterium]
MARDKYFSQAGNLCFALLILTIAAAHFFVNEAREYRILMKAREHAVLWFFYQVNLNPFEAALVFEDDSKGNNHPEQFI